MPDWDYSVAVVDVANMTLEEIENHKCSLCHPLDYDSDWGGGRWIRGKLTICPECGRRFSGKISNGPPVASPRLVERLNLKNENLWERLKRLFGFNKKMYCAVSDSKRGPFNLIRKNNE